MSTPATTLESLRRLETLYSQGYQSEVVDQALRDVVAQELHELRREASLITADIAELERKYQMKSADFQERFNSGTLGDDADFFQWSALNGMAQSLARRLQVLEYGILCFGLDHRFGQRCAFGVQGVSLGLPIQG